jgi:hypothetical protein
MLDILDTAGQEVKVLVDDFSDSGVSGMMVPVW